MKKLFIFLVITFLLGCNQTDFKKSTHIIPSKEITIKDFLGGSFTPQKMNSLNSMNGDYYSLLNRDKNGNSTIDKYHYSSLKKVATMGIPITPNHSLSKVTSTLNDLEVDERTTGVPSHAYSLSLLPL